MGMQTVSKNVTDEVLVDEIARSWCYFNQYVAHEGDTCARIQYFWDTRRESIPSQYSSHESRPQSEIDLLIYQGISIGAAMDDGENNPIQPILAANFLPEINP